MRTISTLLRRRIPLLATASAVAALGLVAVVPLAAQAATPISGAHPYFMPWKLGTPLPVVPAGYTLEAMPSQASMKGIAKGAQFQLTPVALPANGTSAAAASAAATTALAQNANSAGYVNLEMVPTIGGTCTITHLSDDGQFINAVAQSYITDSHDNMGFTYDGGQSSSITVGLSYTNAFGSFSASGTNSVSSDLSQPYPYEIGKNNTYWRTYFLWGNFREVCVSKFTSVWFFSEPYAWIGGANEYHPGSVHAYRVCTPEYYGAEPVVNHTTASTVNVAFNDTTIGFSGDSQTGYSTTAAIPFYYGEKGYLCGEYDYSQGGTIGVPVAIP